MHLCDQKCSICENTVSYVYHPIGILCIYKKKKKNLIICVWFMLIKIWKMYENELNLKKKFWKQAPILKSVLMIFW